MKRVSSFLALAAFLACTQPPANRLTPPMFARSNAFWERMAFLMMTDSRVRLKGFDGAVPPNTLVALLDASGNQVATDTSDENGRFQMEADARPGQGFVIRPSMNEVTPLNFEARDRLQALRQSVLDRIAGTGSTPNQVLIPSDAPTTGDTRALVVLSGDNAVDNASLDEGRRVSPLVPLEDITGLQGTLTASPWRAFSQGSRAWVTRYGQGTFSVLDVDSGNVKATSSPLPVQDLSAPLMLDPPADANGDGSEESLANQLLPRHPTDILVMDDVAYVVFANVLTTSAAGHSQYGPGMLAAFDLRSDGTPNGTVHVKTLSFVNPQAVLPHPDGHHVMVSSTGALHRGETWTVQSDGGLDIVATRDLSITRTINLGTFAPSRPVLLPGATDVYVPSLLRARLARVNVITGERAADDVVLMDTENLRSTFECALHATGLVMCAVFDSDALVWVDPRGDEVNPWPFTEPLVINVAESGVKWGLQGLSVRPGRNGVDRAGVDVVMLFSLASRVAALDTRWVFGP